MNDTVEISQSQAKLLKSMTGADSDSQVILRPNEGDPPERVEQFTQNNKEVDELLSAGLIEDITDGLTKPPGYAYEFRVVRITSLGKMLFNERASARPT